MHRTKFYDKLHNIKMAAENFNLLLFEMNLNSKLIFLFFSKYDEYEFSI